MGCPKMEWLNHINEFRISCLQILSLLYFIFTFMFLGLVSLLTSGFLCYHIPKQSFQLGYYVYQHNLFQGFRLHELWEVPELRVKLGCLLVELTVVSAYLNYWYHDRGAENRGSHPKPWLCHAQIWKHIASYFPMKLLVSQTLRKAKHECAKDKLEEKKDQESNKEDHLQVEHCFDPKKNYLLGYHPHGIMGMGAFIHFATEATQFSQRFPGMKSWLTTANANFKFPLLRDAWMCLKLVPATYPGISYLLDAEKCGSTGNVVVIACGGASEALDSRPSDYVLHINKHFGLFKLALLTGTDLVPCVSFGEPNMYKQVWNPKGSLLRRFQEGFQRVMTVSNPFFYARCQMIPYRTPVTTVIGDPIPVEKHEKPTREQVAALKERYLKAWTDLFNEFRQTFDPDAKDVVFV